MKVRTTRRAQADLDAIFAYLDERAPAAALSVKSTIERRISLLAAFPRMAPETDVPGIYELTVIATLTKSIMRSAATTCGSCTFATRGGGRGMWAGVTIEQSKRGPQERSNIRD